MRLQVAESGDDWNEAICAGEKSSIQKGVEGMRPLKVEAITETKNGAAAAHHSHPPPLIICYAAK
jgi:hypothetical protein